jgi:hypothetical protein
MTPSIKKLAEVFGENAKQAKAVLVMTRSELLEIPAAAARDAECYHRPATSDLRLTVLNDLAGTYGVEAFETDKGWCEYLNAGDTYAATLVRFNGKYRVACWGDIAERYAA